jgi:predicted component of viral defense system (DUF524 family)
MTTKTEILSELQAIQKSNRGLLRPEDVVEFAKNPDTALHSKFTWNIQEAAEQHWLHQARNVIRVHVQVIENNSPPVKVFVSLTEDRNKGNGYRSMTDVMSDESRRERLLAQAEREMKTFVSKYSTLKELAPVIAAMKTVRRRRVSAAN